MYVCNCRVAKVNDDDEQCNTEYVGGCLVATTTRKSLSHWQNAEMSCKYDRTLQPILHLLHLSLTHTHTHSLPLSISSFPTTSYNYHKPHLEQIHQQQ